MQLFIDNQEVLTEYPEDIYPNLSYRSIDTYNPSAIKSNYSKSIKLPDHPVNNKIFSQKKDRYDWLLYNNGKIIDNGYCVLDDIVTTYKSKYYDITLYGGLGNFFYTLKGDEDNPKTLADLSFGWEGDTPAYEWSVDNIHDGWHTDDTDSIHHTLKAIPCIDNSSKNFDNTKTIVYEGSSKPDYYAGGIFPSTGSEGGNCKRVDGVDYLLVEGNESTAFQKQDFRIDQMPLGIRYQDIIKACCDPVNNGGYTVNLDPSFFNDDNPYWTNTFVIRRSPLQDHNFDRQEHEYTNWITPDDIFVNPGIKQDTDIDALDDDFFTVTGGNTLTSDDDLLKTSFSLRVAPIIKIDNRVTFENPGSVTELYLYKGQYIDITATLTYTDEYGNPGSAVSSAHIGNLGDYHKIAERIGSTYYFKMDEVNLDISPIIGGINNIKLSISLAMCYGNPDTSHHYFYYKFYQPGVRAWFYDAIPNIKDGSLLSNLLYLVDPRDIGSKLFDAKLNTQYVTESDIDVISYSKKDLLGSSKTPFDYLISYTKMFNLRFNMHEDTKEVDIWTFDKFIDEQILDIEDRIDFGREYTESPRIIEEGSILFDLNPLETDTVKEYLETISPTIFDKEIYFTPGNKKTYFDNSILKIGSINRLSGSLNKRTLGSGNTPFGSITYYGLNQTSPFELDYVSGGDIVSENYNLSYVNDEGVYDFLDLSEEMNDVIVMYSGMKSLNQGTCLLSSPSKDMILYAGKPCYYGGWNSDLSIDTSVSFFGSDCMIVTEIPYFGLVPSTTSSSYALSYENLDYKSLQATSNIYDQYFSSFINKLYKNQKTVTCYVRLENPDLRKIYYFDNQYWLLIEVNNYNFNDDPILCKFVKYTPA